MDDDFFDDDFGDFEDQELFGDFEGDKLKELTELTDDGEKLDIIRTISDDELKMQEILKLKDVNKQKDALIEFRKQRVFSADFIFQNMDKFIEAEDKGKEKEAIKEKISRMYEKNNAVVQNIDFEILDEKYEKLLGEDKINLISCYNTQKRVLALDDKQLEVFAKCVNQYEEKNQTEEWQLLGDEILNHFGGYDELLDNLDLKSLSSKDIDTLSRILPNSNWCEITNIEQIRNYDEIVKKKCDEIMHNENSSIENKKQALVQKIFGHDLNYARDIMLRFGEDNEKLNEGDAKNYVRCLQEIEKCKNPEILREVYENCEPLKINKLFLERSLKNEYCKKYNEGLYIPKEKDREPGEVPIYNAGTDFKMIIHSVAAYTNPFTNEDREKAKNYKNDWNRPSISSQQVCTSYIRNDMLGTAKINSICYGFTNLKEDSLMLSGADNLDTSWKSSLVVEAQTNNVERYYTPDEQINRTERYNEIDFRRIQDGKKMQPNYIVVFKENGKMLNFEEAKNASKQWGDMPIVIVDKDECIKSEKQKVKDMIAEYKKNPSTELKKQINQKIRNNKVTDENFEIELKRERTEDKNEKKVELVKNDKKVEKIGLEDLEKNYNSVSPKDRSKEVGKIKNIYTKMQEIAQKENYERE